MVALLRAEARLDVVAWLVVVRPLRVVAERGRDHRRGWVAAVVRTALGQGRARERAVIARRDPRGLVAGRGALVAAVGLHERLVVLRGLEQRGRDQLRLEGNAAL